MQKIQEPSKNPPDLKKKKKKEKEIDSLPEK